MNFLTPRDRRLALERDDRTWLQQRHHDIITRNAGTPMLIVYESGEWDIIGALDLQAEYDHTETGGLNVVTAINLRNITGE